MRRTRNARGVTIPSQARFVRYFAIQCAAQAAAAAASAAAAPTPPLPLAVSPARCRLVSSSASTSPLWPDCVETLVEVERDGARAPGFSLAAENLTDGADVVVVAHDSYEPPAAVDGGGGWEPVATLVGLGDAVLAVDGTPVASLAEATRLLRGEPTSASGTAGVAGAEAASGAEAAATAAPLPPLRILLRTGVPRRTRVAAHPSLVNTDDAAFWRAVAGGVGPWASGAAASAAPRPAVRVTSVALSAFPALFCARGCGRDESARALFWDIRQGDFCRGASAARLAAAADAAGAPRWAPAAADAVPLLRGDLRLSLYRAGRRKALAELWLHTAFLPLPAGAREALTATPAPDARAAAQATAPTLGALFTAGRAAPDDALCGARACGEAVFSRAELDGVVKDKRARRWPRDITLTIAFEVVP